MRHPSPPHSRQFRHLSRAVKRSEPPKKSRGFWKSTTRPPRSTLKTSPARTLSTRQTTATQSPNTLPACWGIVSCSMRRGDLLLQREDRPASLENSPLRDHLVQCEMQKCKTRWPRSVSLRHLAKSKCMNVKQDARVASL